MMLPFLSYMYKQFETIVLQECLKMISLFNIVFIIVLSVGVTESHIRKIIDCS